MQRILHAIALAMFSLLLATSAHAQYLSAPKPGFFWNPAEPGKGWAIEVQDNLVFIASYTFQPSGIQSVFYTTIGTWDGINKRVTGDLLEFTGGPCLNCGPANPSSRNLGTITFEFPTRDSGTVVFQGRRTPVVRLLYKYVAEARSLLSGVWHTTKGDGAYFGDFLRIIGPCTGSSCAGLVDPFYGYRVDGGAQRILLGALNPNVPGEAIILIDSSTSYYDLYRIRGGLDVFAGSSNVYLKTSTPTGNGLPLVGSRVLGGPNEANIVLGPQTIPPPPGKAMSGAALDDHNRELATLSANADSPRVNMLDGKLNPAGDDPAIRTQLERALEELRKEL